MNDRKTGNQEIVADREVKRTEAEDKRGRSGFTRRAVLTSTGAAVGVAVTGFGETVLAQPERGPASQTIPLDDDWLFGGQTVEGATQPDFDDGEFEQVTLPHCVTELSWWDWDLESWTDIWIYRRHFDLPSEVSGMRVFLDFEGAMTGTTPTLNGEQLDEHLGGYLPFNYEITNLLEEQDNVLAVELDSDSRSLNVPPVDPKDPSVIDYLQPGGLYRGVSLHVVPQTFISDVFAKPSDVLSDSDRRLEVKCSLDSTIDSSEPVLVEAELNDGDRQIARKSVESSSIDESVELTLDGLEEVTLWDVGDPNLYDVRVRLRERPGHRPIHEYNTRVGFREARFEKDGFFLNGRRLKLFGLNRHQLYPYMGMAMPERIQRKDAELLKEELNCNMVRCAHYPQSQHFLDACDELGLLVWEEPASWMSVGDNTWQDRFVRSVENLIVRDRNRPSVIMWSVEVNHSKSSDLSSQELLALYSRTRQAAKSVDDSRPTTAAPFFPGYDKDEYLQDVWSPMDYSTNPDGSSTLNEPGDDYPHLVSEAIGSLAGPPLYRRTDSVDIQQTQASLHALVHNEAASDDRYSGVLAWSAIDYPSLLGGARNYKNTKFNGVIDIFRVPKLGASIYRAQVDPEEKVVLEPAFYWDFGADSPEDGPPTVATGEGSMVCSNCDRLEFYIDGKLVADTEPAQGKRYGDLPYPPFFVDLTVENGPELLPELRIDGYLNGKKAISRSFSADTQGDQLLLKVDDGQIAGDGIDMTRVVFRAVDEYGAPRPFVEGDVELAVEGPGIIVGDDSFTFEDAGGVGAVWVRSTGGSGGWVRLSAEHPTLGTQTVDIEVTDVSAGPRYVETEVPSLLLPGGSGTVTVSFTNGGFGAVEDVHLGLGVPDGWTVEATSPAELATVTPGETVTTDWEVTVPEETQGGDYDLAGTANYLVKGERKSIRSHDTPLPVTVASMPRPLQELYNNAGTSPDSNVDAGDFDGVGDSYSRQALAEEGLSPGAEVTHDGVTFTWPDTEVETPDNVLCDGQTVAVSGSSDRLGFLGSTSRGPITGSGIIAYADGSIDEFTLTLDDYWREPSSDSNEIVAKMPYLNSQGVGQRPRGQRDHTVYVFYTSVPITPDKEVLGVILPEIGSTVANGQPGMHVFAISVGPELKDEGN